MRTPRRHDQPKDERSTKRRCQGQAGAEKGNHVSFLFLVSFLFPSFPVFGAPETRNMCFLACWFWLCFRRNLFSLFCFGERREKLFLDCFSFPKVQILGRTYQIWLVDLRKKEHACAKSLWTSLRVLYVGKVCTKWLCFILSYNRPAVPEDFFLLPGRFSPFSARETFLHGFSGSETMETCVSCYVEKHMFPLSIVSRRFVSVVFLGCCWKRLFPSRS